jgi:hypothetical protein
MKAGVIVELIGEREVGEHEERGKMGKNGSNENRRYADEELLLGAVAHPRGHRGVLAGPELHRPGHHHQCAEPAPFERLVEVRVDRVDVLRDERAEVAVQLRPPGVDRRRVRHHRASVHEQRDEDGDRHRTQAVQQVAVEARAAEARARDGEPGGDQHRQVQRGHVEPAREAAPRAFGSEVRHMVEHVIVVELVFRCGTESSALFVLSAAGSAPRVSTRTPHKSRSNATNAITDEMREDYVGEGMGKQSCMDKYCDHVSDDENNCSP